MAGSAFAVSFSHHRPARPTDPRNPSTLGLTPFAVAKSAFIVRTFLRPNPCRRSQPAPKNKRPTLSPTIILSSRQHPQTHCVSSPSAISQAQFVAIGETHFTRETPEFAAAVCRTDAASQRSPSKQGPGPSRLRRVMSRAILRISMMTKRHQGSGKQLFLRQ